MWVKALEMACRTTSAASRRNIPMTVAVELAAAATESRIVVEAGRTDLGFHIGLSEGVTNLLRFFGRYAITVSVGTAGSTVSEVP